MRVGRSTVFGVVAAAVLLAGCQPSPGVTGAGLQPMQMVSAAASIVTGNPEAAVETVTGRSSQDVSDTSGAALQSWIGQDAGTLYATLGQPHRVIPLGGGSQVFVYSNYEVTRDQSIANSLGKKRIKAGGFGGMLLNTKVDVEKGCEIEFMIDGQGRVARANIGKVKNSIFGGDWCAQLLRAAPGSA